MPPLRGDRFSSQSMSDCAFCPPDGRRYRTTRQCAGCSQPLCLVCRPDIPGVAYLCPDCGGGACENAIAEPAAVLARLTAAGQTPPYWLVLHHERLTAAQAPVAEELIVPE
jgi:hypothetical protein